MISNESSHDGGAKGTGRVDACTGKVGAADVGNKNRNTDTNGGQESSAVLLNSEQIDCENELCSEKHLNEEAAHYACTVPQIIGDAKWPGQQSITNRCSGNASDKLCRNYEESADRRNGTNKYQSEGNLEKSSEMITEQSVS